VGRPARIDLRTDVREPSTVTSDERPHCESRSSSLPGPISWSQRRWSAGESTTASSHLLPSVR
jgi:hypothetical protein